jgi:hypothetical protein
LEDLESARHRRAMFFAHAFDDLVKNAFSILA